MKTAWRRDVRMLAMLVDLLAIIVAFELSFVLRPMLNSLFRAQIDSAQLHHLVPPLGLMLILWVCSSPWLRLYRPRSGSPVISTMVQTVEAVGLILVLTIVTTFFLGEFRHDYSRSFIIFLGVIGSTAMLAAKGLLYALLGVGVQGALGAERVLVLGSGPSTKQLIEKLRRAAKRSMRICGIVTPDGSRFEPGPDCPVEVVGKVSDLAALVNRHSADRVIAVEEEVSREELLRCVVVLRRMGIPVNYASTVLDNPATRVALTDVGGVRLVELRAVEFSRLQLLGKRIFDLAAASFLLVLISPLMLALALLIKLTSKGPVLFVAPRVGKGGRYFNFFKFRTMVREAEHQRENLAGSNQKSGHLFKLLDDPRVTPVGRFMRKYSLDELPQLLNVILGDMSLVGPRPLPATDLELDGLSSEYRVWARIRTVIRPGISGLWQVRGRSNADFEEMMRYDLAYVRMWSFKLDLRILLETLPAVVGGRGAY